MLSFIIPFCFTIYGFYLTIMTVESMNEFPFGIPLLIGLCMLILTFVISHLIMNLFVELAFAVFNEVKNEK